MNRTRKAGLMVAAMVPTIFFGLKGFRAAPLAVDRVLDQSHVRAPDFSLTGIYGHRLQLASYRGKVVVVDFWATWCQLCTTEIPRYISLQKKYQPEGFQIIGISMDDDPEPVRDFYKRFRMNYPVVMADEKIGQLYGGIAGLPTTFLIGRDGLIYDRIPGGITDFARFTQEVQVLLADKPRRSRN
jgi:cytochrome c biogenesis protein CcmG, thiol:disulfide interchange protein DsbE